MEYQKINTLFKRDGKNVIIPSQYTCEEFNYRQCLTKLEKFGFKT